MPKVRPQRLPAPPQTSPKPLWISLALLLVTFLVYAQVWHFDFVNYDDPDYVSRNPHVIRGLTGDTIAWAFTSTEAANWFPLTRLSHLLDGQLFGVASGWHHLTNVLIHAIAALLLFGFLYRATRALWPSALVAFVFALHPLHVESVAWIAERKDVLSAFFWFATLYVYVSYAQERTTRRYAIVLALFAAGLLAKPMLVTLPLVLLLVDVWPLDRPRTTALIWEKLPFFALSAASAVTTYVVQHSAGAVQAFATVPLALRVENALVSYAVYLGQMFWPADLAVFYPYPASLPVWQPVLAALLLVGISVPVWRAWPQYPYLAVGWLWFLGTLVPVIGLVQVGGQAHADRYMYIPMTGLAIMLIFGAADVLRRRPVWKNMLLAAASVCAAVVIVTTFIQIGYWRNSETLFQHTIAATGENYLAEHNLGSYLLDVPGRLPDAVDHLEAALRVNPDSVKARTDLGIALARTPGRRGQAIAQFQTALRADPNSAITHNDLGNALMEAGRRDDAIAEYRTALQINPVYIEAKDNLQKALSVDPAEAHRNLGNSLAGQPGHVSEAIAEYQEALRLSPDSAETQSNLAVLLAQAGREKEAIPHLEAALRLRPDFVDAHYNLGIALSKVPGRMPEAISHLEAAERLHPDPQLREEIRRLREGGR